MSYKLMQPCNCPYQPRFYFALDLITDHMVFTSTDVDSAVARWLRAAVGAEARLRYQREWEVGALVGDVAGQSRVAVYTVKYDSKDRPSQVYGFELGSGIVRAGLERTWGKSALLPPELTGAEPNDSLMSLVVTAGDEELYASGMRYDAPFTASDIIGPQFGDVRVTLTLRPEAAEALVIGGLPRSRLPLLAAVLVLTAGLIAVAVVQLKREQELARVRADFVSGVSHELRTPLAQIRMFTETLLLERVRNPEEKDRALDIINRESQRLTHLVENVLQFSRAERDAVQLAPEPVRIDQLLRDTVDTFQPLARARGARVATVIEDPAHVTVDPNALRQVVLNLLDNALKYGPTGQTVTVTLQLDQAVARVTVDDQGPGVPPADRERIWEPFWRLPREHDSAVGGSGIGLAVVRELVGLHSGTTRVLDAPGGGARFEVRLPGARPITSPGGLPAVTPAAVETAR
jgi:signal transduction histidine kinase